MIQEFVEPVGAEGGAVAAFVPAGVGRGVDGPVNEEGRDCPPGTPGNDSEVGADGEQEEPEGVVPEGGAVAALHDLSHLLAGEFGLPPCFLHALDDAVIVEFDSVLMAAGEAVVSGDRLHTHGRSPFSSATGLGADMGQTARNAPKTGAKGRVVAGATGWLQACLGKRSSGAVLQGTLDFAMSPSPGAAICAGAWSRMQIIHEMQEYRTWGRQRAVPPGHSWTGRGCRKGWGRAAAAAAGIREWTVILGRFSALVDS